MTDKIAALLRGSAPKIGACGETLARPKSGLRNRSIYPLKTARAAGVTFLNAQRFWG
ncbi:hypothetical protein [Roseinatronobacter thiooxidans]|uniref:hypothetical protein n=1 Tax=Roseinatronobacter thiooxidans TaxID=121821 RepID=UPI0014734A8A|nr:hypothetical protein [Roseinatronobacter thiooxidans]